MFPQGGPVTPRITTTSPLPSIPPGNVSGISIQMVAAGGQPPYTWQLLSAVPNTGNWVQLSAAGLITGVPTTAETETLTIQVTDFLGQTSQQTFSLLVPIPTTPTNLAIFGATQNSINLQWDTATTDPTYGQALARYDVYVNGVVNVSPAVPVAQPFAVTGLTPATTYTFTVDAQDIYNNRSLQSFSRQGTTNPSSGVGPAPARIWRGPVTSTTASMVSWPPTTGTPDSYNLFRSSGGGPFTKVNGQPILPYVIAANNFPQIYYVDGNSPDQLIPGPLALNTAYTYYWTAVTGGVDSPPGPQMTVTTLNGTNSPVTPPIPPLDPQTWVQPYSLPTGGTTWTATVTQDSAAGTAGTLGSTGKLSVNCSFQYALANCAGGDVIVLTAGATYQSSASAQAWLYSGPAFTGPNFVYVISSQADASLPGYNGAAAKLPAYSYSTTLGGGNYVTPTDKAAMPLMIVGSAGSGPVANQGNGHIFTATATAGTGYVRFVGIAFAPQPTNTSNAIFQLVGTAHGSFATPQAICNQIYFDRCYFGADSNTYLTTFSYVNNAISSNINGLFVHQCYFQGIYNPTNEAHGIAIQAGGPTCIQNNYIEAVTEGVLTGGLYTAETQNVLDIVYRYNTGFKQPFWFNTSYGNFTLTSAPVSGITTSTVAQAWPNSRCRVAVIFSDNSTHYGYISNGPGAGQSTINWTVAQTFPAGLTTAIKLMNPMGLWVKNHFEIKIGQRIACYGNVHSNLSYGFAGQQQACSYVFGPRAVSPTDVFQTNPWDFCTDIDVYNNVVINCGTFGHIFSADNARVTSWMDRVRVANNLMAGNPFIYTPNPVITHGWAIDSAGPTTNFIVDHNTFIIDPTNVSGSSSSFTQGSFSLPNSPQKIDRITFSNNVMDGAFALECGISGTVGGTAALNAGFTNCVQGGNPAAQPAWAGNITVIDTKAYPTGTLATNVGYANLSAWMENFVNNATPPVNPSDWNIIAGPYVAAATDGGPIGSEFGTLAQDPFPRTYWQVISPNGFGTQVYASPTFQTNAAKFNIVNPGPYPGIEQNMGSTFPTIFASIKSQAQANGINPCRCIHYTMSSEQSIKNGTAYPGNAGNYTVWTDTVNAANSGTAGTNGVNGVNGWWIRTAPPGYGTGNVVTFDASSGVTAITAQNTILSGGNTIYQAYWNHYDGVLRQGNAVSQGYAAGLAFVANASLDGYQMDNCFCQPRSAGAWGMDATNYAVGNAQAAAWIQQGQASQVAALRALNPSLIILGNCDYYVHSTVNFSTKATLDPTQNGLFDVVYCQGVIGMSSSIEGQGVTTIAQLMANLIAAEAQMAPNGSLIMEQCGRSRGVAFSSNAQASWVAADWQAARFGLALTCMRNWHFALNNQQDYRPDRVYFMDEMLTQGGRFGWLGAPVDAPQSAGRTNGVWWRKFQKGVVFMNPTGNGTQVINLSSIGLTGLKAIASNGFGDTSINTGLAVTSITLLARDGRFLTF